jgi:hypothetical protein
MKKGRKERRKEGRERGRNEGEREGIREGGREWKEKRYHKWQKHSSTSHQGLNCIDMYCW